MEIFNEFSPSDVKNYDALMYLINNPSWIKLNNNHKLKKPIMKLCVKYLIKEKHNNIFAYDPVANFHLRNGALIGIKNNKINWKIIK